jgi:uncharacterized protein YbjQ (UPF0145 family)
MSQMSVPPAGYGPQQGFAPQGAQPPQGAPQAGYGPQGGYQQQQPQQAPFLVVTTNDVPGYKVDTVLGEVFGLTVRSRNAFSAMGSQFKSIVGGELKGQTKNLIDSRNEVMNRMIGEAVARGANAVVAMRFDTSEIAPGWTEICAYGTAVRISKA